MEMLELGVFGGWYFEGDIAEYPAEWFENVKLSTNGFDMTLNCFNIASGLNRTEWQAKGWITPEDPLGWFQWYCRYVMGRRLPDVDRFIHNVLLEFSNLMFDTNCVVFNQFIIVIILEYPS